MKYSLLYQVFNAASGALVLMVVLIFFDQSQYLQWVLFSTIGGIAIQLESSIGAISSRHLSRYVQEGYRVALRNVSRLYCQFSVVLFVAMVAIGGLYLGSVDGGRFSSVWFLEWAIMCGGYLATYLFAHNYCRLISEGRLGRFASVNLTVRVAYLLTGLALLSAGAGVLGLSIAFFVSAVLGSVLFRISVRRVTLPEVSRESSASSLDRNLSLSLSHVVYHCLFMSAAYVLYRYGLLIAAADAEETSAAASFGLALQFITLISSVAAAPVNLRIVPMVSAIRAGDCRAVIDDLAFTLLVANGAYLTGVFALLLFGQDIISLLPMTDVDLPAVDTLALLSVGGLIEINILVLVNVLVAARRFGFVALYVLACCGCWLLGALFFWGGGEFLSKYVGAVAAIQACMVLPLILRLVAMQLGRKALVLTRDIVRAAFIRIRRLSISGFA